MTGAILRSLRPRQWTKNLLVFAAPLFALRVHEPHVFAATAAGFGVFCLLSGSVYLLNDVKDREKDQLHPVKRRRPIASGELSAGLARGIAWVLLVASLGAAYSLGVAFAAVAAGYLLLNVLYSFLLRRLVLLDILSIATGFVLRAIAGAELMAGVGEAVPISPWLLLCTFFLSLFLALGKRRSELATVGDGHRSTLRNYSLPLVDQLTTVTVSVTILSYSIYTIWPDTVEHVGSGGLLFTVPFVVYGLGRYLFLVQQEGKGGDPSEMLLTDRSIRWTVVLWVLAVALVLYRGWGWPLR